MKNTVKINKINKNNFTAINKSAQSALKGGMKRFEELRATSLADADSETFDR